MQYIKHWLSFILCRLLGHIYNDTNRYCGRCHVDLTPHDTRRRVVIKEGQYKGRIGTVYATYPPDYSNVMIDGCSNLQAYREHEIYDEMLYV